MVMRNNNTLREDTLIAFWIPVDIICLDVRYVLEIFNGSDSLAHDSPRVLGTSDA